MARHCANAGTASEMMAQLWNTASSIFFGQSERDGNDITA